MKQYFYIDSNNQQVGPVGEDVLWSLVHGGKISPQTYIWAEGMPGWQPVCAVFPGYGKKSGNKNVLWIVFGVALFVTLIIVGIAGAEAQRDAEAQAAEARYYRMRANLNAEARRHQSGQSGNDDVALRRLEQLISTGEISSHGRMEVCKRCDGTGVVRTGDVFSPSHGRYEMLCPQCQGAGRCPANQNPHYYPY